MKFLEELTQIWGVAGREKKVCEAIKREAAPFADEINTDALGNLIVLKKGNGTGKRIMLTAHMDEIGFQVTKIEADGRLRVCNVGWVWASSIYNGKVVFQNGTIGVVGCAGNIEDAKNNSSKLYIDIGCTSKEEAAQYINVGDYCGFLGPYHELCNGRISAKSLDDRVGCYVLTEALKRNDGKSCNDIYYVFTVQEEIGCRGSAVAAERIKPNIGISMDVTPDHAYPCDLEGSNAVGEGVGIKIGDPSAVQDEYLVEEMLNCCSMHGIKHQRDVMDRGGTDSSGMNKAYYGTRVAGISVVTRYPHSQSAVIAKDDVTAAIELVDKYTSINFEFEK
ncbi:M42 family metallopeptidase [Sedimentibacter sp.]|uniref:M42 family metallopeptidase n=1 Tax=Sedimentibacter sp. TaxID=1960295 RepID=UPI0028B17471|nr:M42 family metallopeptidase [Sedimentibacter sp.]